FIKVSPQFDRLAATNLFYQDVELFEFNPSTGVLSNPIIINYPNIGAAGGPYGIEFSCSGEVLYVSDGSNLTQFDLSGNSASAIASSAYAVLSNSFSCYGLQLGPDRKIYVSNGALDVIDNPDALGSACGYTQGAIANQSSGGGWGLPQWVYRVGDTPISCEDCQVQTTSISVFSCGSFTDGSGTLFTSSGVYSDTLQGSNGCDSIVQMNLTLGENPEVSFSATSQGCGNQTAFEVSANGTGPFTFEIPSLGITNNTGSFVLNTGVFSVIITNSEGCVSTIELDNLNVESCPEDFNSDFVIGVDDLLEFNAAYGCNGNCCPYDLNGDNAVSVTDLLLFIAAFGSLCV
ncbi:MAG: hypothetical protein ACKOZY_01865, partial [Flavobacteriales bacterium]